MQGNRHSRHVVRNFDAFPIDLSLGLFSKISKSIIEAANGKMSLALAGMLTYGVVIIHQQQVQILYGKL